MTLMFATHILGTGCATKTPLRAASAEAIPPPYVQCVGEFVEFEPDYPWFENWVDPDGNECHSDGNSARAVFRISSPSAYTNRTVGILYKYEGKDLLPSPDVSLKGRLFSFEVPEDFFTGNFGTIDNIHVKNMEKMP